MNCTKAWHSVADDEVASEILPFQYKLQGFMHTQMLGVERWATEARSAWRVRFSLCKLHMHRLATLAMYKATICMFPSDGPVSKKN